MIGGKVVTEVQKKKVGGNTVETIEERTEGAVPRWGNENSPDMDWFRADQESLRRAQLPGCSIHSRAAARSCRRPCGFLVSECEPGHLRDCRCGWVRRQARRVERAAHKNAGLTWVLAHEVSVSPLDGP